MKNHKTQGQTSVEQLVVLTLVAAAGLSGLTTVGTATTRALRGDAQDGAPVPMATSRQAGAVESLRAAAEVAINASERMSRRIRGAAAETDPFLRMDGVVPWTELKPENAAAAVQRGVELATQRLQTLESRRPRTISRTLRTLDTADAEIGYAMRAIEHQSMVIGTPEWHAALDEADTIATAFNESLTNNERLQATLQRLDGGLRAKLLRGDKRTYWRQVVDGYRREGVALPAKERARLTEINLELSELSRTFGKNLSNSRKDFTFHVEDAAELDGLPAEYLGQARAAAEAAGKDGYILSFADGTVDAAMGRVHSAALRERLHYAKAKVASAGETDNLPTITRMLALRSEKASILGFKNFSDYTVSDRMVKTGDAATAFIDDLAARTRPFVEKELADLRAFRKSVDGSTELHDWDLKYWLQRQADTLIDSQVVRDYFPADQVLQGFFTTAEKLYGIKFEALDIPTWTDGVRSFRVRDVDGRELGTIQFDLFSRDGKRPGAWQETLKPGAGKEPTTALIVGNFDPPAPGKEARLYIGDVETLFHEGGHALHAILGNADAKYGSLAGTNVAWDFVELPSQIMENFVWEDDVLAYLAKHGDTGLPLPEELLRALKIRRTTGAALEQMRTLVNSKIDLALHQSYNPATDGSVTEYVEKVARAMVPADMPASWVNITNFNHLFGGGYASGYYGYKWAEVLDADAFTQFKADGVLSRRVGQKFRDELLSRGGSKSGDELFKRFAGRNPDPEALMRRLGLVE